MALFLLSYPVAARISLLAASMVWLSSRSFLAREGLTSTRSRPRRQPLAWTSSSKVRPSRRVKPPGTRIKSKEFCWQIYKQTKWQTEKQMTSTRSRPRRQPLAWTSSSKVRPSRRVKPPGTRIKISVIVDRFINKQSDRQINKWPPPGQGHVDFFEQGQAFAESQTSGN